MSNLAMPKLTVAFKQAANTAVARSQKGVVALILVSLFVLKLLYDNYFRWVIVDLIGSFFKLLHMR